MPGTRYDEDLDNWIVRILLDSRRLELGHNQLQRELNLRLEDKASTATLSSHLKRLCGGEILDRRVEQNGHTHYSLTERFRAVLESERKHNPIRYLDNALLRFDRTKVRSFHKEVSPMDYFHGNYKIGRKRKSI